MDHSNVTEFPGASAPTQMKPADILFLAQVDADCLKTLIEAQRRWAEDIRRLTGKGCPFENDLLSETGGHMENLISLIQDKIDSMTGYIERVSDAI
jgi:hypothetical protein